MSEIKKCNVCGEKNLKQVLDLGKQPLGDGKPWRPLVHVQDICKAIILVSNAPRDTIHNQAFNVGSNQENYQIISIAKKIQEQFKSSQISVAQKDAKDTRDYKVSFKKIENLLGFKPDWSLEKGIKELKSNYQKINLNKEIFESRFFTRLKQIEYLINNKIVNQDLFFIKELENHV